MRDVMPLVFMRSRPGEPMSAWLLRAPFTPERLSEPGVGADHPHLTPEGGAVIYSRQEAGLGLIVRRELDSGREERLAGGPGHYCHHPVLSPLTGCLAYQERTEHGSRQRVGLGPGARTLPEGAYNAVDLGPAVLFHQKAGPMAGHIGLFEQEHVHFLPGPGTDRRPTVSTDGQWLAWQRRVGTLERLVLAPRAGGPTRLVGEGPWSDGHPWFSRDGAWLLHESDRLGSLELWATHLASGCAVQLTRSEGDYLSAVPRT